MKRLLLYFLLILALCALFMGCGSSSGNSGYNVKYEITGTNIIDLKYTDADENEISIDDLQLPWSYSFSGAKGKKVMISYRRETYDGQIISKITVNGKVKESFVDNPENIQLFVAIWDYL